MAELPVLEWTKKGQFIISNKQRMLRKLNCVNHQALVDSILGVYILNADDIWTLIEGTNQLSAKELMGSMTIKLNTIFVISYDGVTTVLFDRTNGNVTRIKHKKYGKAAEILNVKGDIYLIGGIGNDKIYHFNEQNNQYDEFMDGHIQTDECQIVIKNYKVLISGYLENVDGEWIRNRIITELDVQNKTIQILPSKTLNDRAAYMREDNVLIAFGNYPSGFSSNGGYQNDLQWSDIYTLQLKNGDINKTIFEIPTETEVIFFKDNKKDKYVMESKFAASGYIREAQKEFDNITIPMVIEALILLFYMLPKGKIHLVDTDDSTHYILSSKEVEKLKKELFFKEHDI